MSVTSDERLGELLRQCRRDLLIDAYEERDSEIVIRVGYVRHCFTRETAVRFLRGVLMHAPDLYGMATLFADASRVRPPMPRAGIKEKSPASP